MFGDNDNEFLEIIFDNSDILRVNYRDLPSDRLLKTDDIPTDKELGEMIEAGEWHYCHSLYVK